MEDSKTISFLKYINKPMTRESIDMLYNANNIKRERCELYGDFIKSVMLLMFDTYMGDDITPYQDQITHFRWCWDKTCSNFKTEGIDICNEALYNYFLEVMLEVYYALSNKNVTGNTHNNLLKLWAFIFDFNNTKAKSDIDTLIEVYNLFEKSLNK